MLVFRSILTLGIDLKAANIMCCLPEATSEDKLRALLATDPSRRHPPEPSWEHPVEAAVSQPLPPPSLQRALSASFMISDFGSGESVVHLLPTTSVVAYILYF